MATCLRRAAWYWGRRLMVFILWDVLQSAKDTESKLESTPVSSQSYKRPLDVFFFLTLIGEDCEPAHVIYEGSGLRV